jgi:hypothetical protein
VLNERESLVPYPVDAKGFFFKDKPSSSALGHTKPDIQRDPDVASSA